MPLQSRRVALSALGIDQVEGLQYGVHLRIAFDPRMGFPACGFELYRRVHRKGGRHTLDIDRLFLERQPALFRSGYSQDGLIVFQAGSERPDQSALGGIAIGSRKLGLTFRPTPFSPDSSPKVCEVRLRVRSRGRVEAEAFDDRHDGTTFDKTLVARATSNPSVTFDFNWLEQVVAIVHRGWSRVVRFGLYLLLGDRIGVSESVPREGAEPEGAAGLHERLRRATDGDVAERFGELAARHLPELADPEVPTGAAPPLEPPPGRPGEGADIAGTRAFLARALLGLNRLLNRSVFRIVWPFFGGTHELVLRADLISLVEVSAPAGSMVESVEYVEVLDAGWREFPLPPEEPWGQIKELPLLLPTADPKLAGSVYPTCPDLEFSQEPADVERELPRSRLDSGFVPLTGSDDVHGEYADAQTHSDVYLGPEPELPRLRELIEALRELQAVAPPDQIAVLSSHGESEENATFAILPLVLIGSIDPSFARLVGLATIDKSTKRSEHWDYKAVATWNGVQHSWITHDVFPGRDGFLKDPAAAAAEAQRDPFRASAVQTVVDLSWQAPTPVARLDRARQYVGYHVFRRRVDEPGPRRRLTESNDELTDVPTPDLLLLAEVQGEGPTLPPSSDQGSYRDAPPAYGEYDYGLQAQDLFGRRSKIVWTEGVDVPVLVDPPPVTSLYAFYLDTDDPEQAELVEDAATAIIEATGQAAFTGRALLVSFRYPEANIAAIHGDVQAFEMSYRHGRPNELLGTLAEPTIVGPPPDTATAPVLVDVDLLTVIPVPAAIDGYGSERARGTLASRGEHFAIESATFVEPHRVRLRVHARRDYLPQEGEAALAIGSGTDAVSAHPLHVSPTAPEAWTGFDVRQPGGADVRPVLRLSGADSLMLDPPPLQVDAANIVIVRSVESPIGETGLAADWVYRVFIPGIELPQPAGLTGYPGSVTVQVVSGADRRSPLPQPAIARRRRFGPPDPLTSLASADFMLATRPDFEGSIGARITWPSVPGITRYKVHRAEVQRLLLEREADSTLADGLLENEEGRATVKLLGGQHASLDAFTVVTPVPVRAEADPQASGRRLFTDRFAAPRDASYVYRVQPVGPLGEDAMWPPDSADDNANRDRCVLVLQRNRDLVPEPSLYELTPLDRSVGVVVRQPGSPGIVGMRIYKTTDPARAGDLREMTLIQGTLPLDHERLEPIEAADGEPARLRFVDAKVRVGQQYYYRLVFVDEFGNVSLPSQALTVAPLALTPPAPPTLAANRTSAEDVHLTWLAEHDEGEVRVQRKRSGEGSWLDVGDALLQPSDELTDQDASGIVAHRLLLRDVFGRFVYSDVVITEA